MATQVAPKRVTLTVKQASARKVAIKLMHEYGLTGWAFRFDRAKRSLGQCHFGKKVISLSSHWVEQVPAETIESAIRHEIAHALAGFEAGHGRLWRAHALRVGAEPRTCISTGDATVESAWLGTCPNGHVSQAHRSPKRVRTCGKCSRSFNPAYLLEWKHRGKTVPMRPEYQKELQRIKRSMS